MQRETKAMVRRALSTLAVIASVVLSGCATIPPNAGNDPRDPFEVSNRHVFEFNQGFDDGFLKPLAETWKILLPEEIRTCLGNAFANLRGVSLTVNALLQGKPDQSLESGARFVVNSTVGLLGCIDVASSMGLERYDEDFGQTLGVWGFPPGPYLVVPVFGPSSVRDAIGIFGVEPFLDLNFYINNPTVEYTIAGLRIVNARAELLGPFQLLEDAALDRYAFVRDGYLQRRRNLVYDGNPPRLPDDDLDPDDAAATPTDSKPATPTSAPNPAPDVKPASGTK
jgi:phospholipid-binding lipoprotein MlaA